MATTLTSLVTHTIRMIEKFTSSFVDPTNPDVTFDGLDLTLTLNAGSTPPCSKHSEGSKALSGGAGTIDLTALPLEQGGTFDGTGLKVQVAEFSNPATNANPITITFGAANPYALLGATFVITLQPGQNTGPMFLNGAAPAIDGTHKNIDLSGTGTQALSYVLILG